MRKAAMSAWMMGVACGATLMLGVPDVTAVEADPAGVARSLVDNYVLPRHQALAEATARFEEATRAFCTAPDEVGLAAVDAGFSDSVDAWLAVEPLQFGPIELLMRSPRM